METKDYFLIAIAIIGAGWGIIQFVLNRKYQKSDRLLQKRFEVYTNFMNQIDEISVNMRTDPNMMFGLTNSFMAEVLTGEQERIDAALLKFNSELIESTKKVMQPLMIANNELNKLKLVASQKLLPKIEEYKNLVNDYTNEYRSVLDTLSVKDKIELTAEKLKPLGKGNRSERMTQLWLEMEPIMREEIGNIK